MNAGLRNILIFFLGLFTAASLLQSMIRFQLGPQIFVLDSFLWWFVIISVTNFTASVLTLKYYQHQNYKFALFAGAISTIINICQAIVGFTMLEYHKLSSYNIPLLLLSLVIGIVYAISLIFLGLKRKYWLAITGIFMFIVGLHFLITIIRMVYFPAGILNTTIEKIAQWTDLASSFVPLLFILHFLRERKKLPGSNTEMPMQKQVIGLMASGIVCFILMLIYGVWIFSESRAKMYWAQYNYNKTKELAKLFEFKIFKNSNGNTLMYELLRPLNYDSSKKYPLVVSLPYGGQPGTDTIKQIEGAVAAELLSTESNRENILHLFLFLIVHPAEDGEAFLITRQ